MEGGGGRWRVGSEAGGWGWRGEGGPSEIVVSNAGGRGRSEAIGGACEKSASRFVTVPPWRKTVPSTAAVTHLSA